MMLSDADADFFFFTFFFETQEVICDSSCGEGILYSSCHNTNCCQTKLTADISTAFHPQPCMWLPFYLNTVCSPMAC